jgi:hypothetical protein
VLFLFASRSCASPFAVADMAPAVQYPVRVTDAKDPIYALLLCADDDSKGIVATADRLEILLAEKKLLYHLRIAPRSVGVDPSNRDGEGINPLNVVALASEIASVGWSDSEVGKAICCEVSPLDGTVEAFNVKLSTGSGMAEVEANSIHYGSLACSHTNYVLRCIAGGVASDDEHLADHGCMSVSKLAGRDPAFADVVATGLSWKVLSWQVRYMYPQALVLIQQARNIASTMHRSETEAQGLLKLGR